MTMIPATKFESPDDMQRFCHLISLLLLFNPLDRPTAFEALEHEVFVGMSNIHRSIKHPPTIKGIKGRLDFDSLERNKQDKVALAQMLMVEAENICEAIHTRESREIFRELMRSNADQQQQQQQQQHPDNGDDMLIEDISDVEVLSQDEGSLESDNLPLLPDIQRPTCKITDNADQSTGHGNRPRDEESADMATEADSNLKTMLAQSKMPRLADDRMLELRERDTEHIFTEPSKPVSITFPKGTHGSILTIRISLLMLTCSPLCLLTYLFAALAEDQACTRLPLSYSDHGRSDVSKLRQTSNDNNHSSNSSSNRGDKDDEQIDVSAGSGHQRRLSIRPGQSTFGIRNALGVVRKFAVHMFGGQSQSDEDPSVAPEPLKISKLT
jgi:hypothetical protein